ncbi:NADPH:quinone oxidoreductase family protein [Marinicrinis sediminis]|uniref:Acryloyl-CoA reductase n=1 Tax=Marinicrinis sediminis TaxID=1652465 RepID=A0ABW5RFU8_9BACL
MKSFQALMLHQEGDQTRGTIQQLKLDDLPEGEVVIRVAYSSVNYKDGLASLPGRIVKSYPFIPGIDLAGVVLQSSDERYAEGDEVIVTSYELGVSHFGGFSEIARVRADWVVPLPARLTMREAMTLGTAGFTAALSILRLEQNGLRPEQGPVLVTGATGGVGSVAVDILAQKGYQVTAATGKESEHAYLKQLGASEILSREEVAPQDGKPLRRQQWAGAVDPVGGATLSYICSSLAYNGSVALSGLTGGGEFSSTVYPFILRGVNLLGIDSVYCPMELRKQVWERLASTDKPKHLEDGVGREIGLDEVPEAMQLILQGKLKGRTVVKL